MSKWPCFSKKGTLRDLYFWFKKNGKYEKNLSRLESILWNSDEDYYLPIIEESLNENSLNKKYLEKLGKANSGHADFILGRYYIEQVSDFIRGYNLLLSAKKKGYTKKVDKYIEEKGLNTQYDQWRNIDIQYMKEYIEKCVDNKMRFQTITLVPKEKDGHEWTKREEQLALFVIRCCFLKNNLTNEQKNLTNEQRVHLAQKYIYERNANNELSVKEPFLLQKHFVFTIVGLKHPSLSDNFENLLKDLAEYYYPAKYLLDSDETHPILDKVLFRELGIVGKINIILNYLFEF